MLNKIPKLSQLKKEHCELKFILCELFKRVLWRKPTFFFVLEMCKAYRRTAYKLIF